MNLYTSLTFRYLKQNKKRTLVTIIGIILSTALICGIGNICVSFIDYEIRQTTKDNGSYYATFEKMSKKDINTISKTTGVTEYAYSDIQGYSKVPNSPLAPTLQIVSYDNKMMDSFPIKISEGKAPTNNKEIIVEDSTLDYLHKEIGDYVDLNVGDDYKKPTTDINTGNSSKYKVLNEKSQTYKIVGTISSDEYQRYSKMNIVISYLDINSISDNDKLNISIKCQNPKDIYNLVNNISKNIGLKQITEDGKSYFEGVEYNENLLRLLGASKYENVVSSITSIIILFTSLVVVATIATVYNSFSISISERRKQFGILKSIGATKSQVMRIVFLESLLVSIISIPIGLLSGSVAIDIVFKVINNLLSDSLISQMDLRIVFSPAVMIISTLVVLLSIIVSVIIPAINAAKISPLESIKNSSNLKIGKVKNSKIIKKIFKTEGMLAYKNLRRNKTKFRITLFSLIISIVIFLSFSGFMNMFIQANEIVTGEIKFDLTASNKITQHFNIKEENKFIKEVHNIHGVKNISSGHSIDSEVYINKKDINKNHKGVVDELFEKTDNNTYKFTNSHIRFPGNAYLKDINLIDGKFDKQTALKENGVILIRKSSVFETGKRSEVALTDYKVGDTLKTSVITYDKDGNEKKIKKEFKILAITDDKLLSDSSYPMNCIDFITYDEIAKGIYKESNSDIIMYSYYISTDKSDATIKKIKQFLESKNFSVENFLDLANEMNDTIMAMNIFVYGFIFVISLVSITNIVNTISTNINLRKKELAVIHSIGVTPSGFKKMIYLESFLYGALSLLYGIPISIGLNLLMFNFIGEVISFEVALPIKSILICVVGIFVITFISSYFPMKKINKENIIDNIRQESI